MKKHSCPIFMPGHKRIGRFDTFDSSRVMWPLNPGSMNPAVEWVSRPSLPSELLPSSLAAMWGGRPMSSSVEPSTNSPGCRMKPSSGLTSICRVSSGQAVAGSITAYLWLSKSLKYLSSRTSTLAGCTISGSVGSNCISPVVRAVVMSRSESSTF